MALGPCFLPLENIPCGLGIFFSLAQVTTTSEGTIRNRTPGFSGQFGFGSLLTYQKSGGSCIGQSGTMTHLQAGLSPETLEKARLELNENPDTLHQDIQEVRDMVITRPDIGFLRTDDAFILRFLRARKFQHFEAFRLLAQYFEYRQQNLDMFKSFKATDPGIKQALKDGFPGGLANLDHYGRKILVLFAANWDQSRMLKATWSSVSFIFTTTL